MNDIQRRSMRRAESPNAAEPPGVDVEEEIEADVDLKAALPDRAMGVNIHAPVSTVKLHHDARGTIWRAGPYRVDCRGDIPLFSFGTPALGERKITWPVTMSWTVGQRTFNMVLFWKERDDEIPEDGT